MFIKEEKGEIQRMRDLFAHTVALKVIELINAINFMATNLATSQKESPQQIKFPAMDLLGNALLTVPVLGTLFLNLHLLLLISLR